MEKNNADISLYEEEALTLTDLLQIIKRYIFSIIICIGLFFSLMMAYSFTIQKPVYSSYGTVMVNPTTSSGTSANSDYAYVQRIMSTYEILFKSRLVIGEVSNNIKNYQHDDGTISHLKYSPSQLQAMTTIQVQSGTVVANVDSLIFKITVTGSNADDCAIIANEIIKVTKSLPQTGGDFAILRNSTLTEVDEALPNYAYSKNLFRNGIIGIALGVVASVVYIVLRELTDTNVSDARTLENLLKLNVIAVVPDLEMMEREKNKQNSKEKK